MKVEETQKRPHPLPKEDRADWRRLRTRVNKLLADAYTFLDTSREVVNQHWRSQALCSGMQSEEYDWFADGFPHRVHAGPPSRSVLLSQLRKCEKPMSLCEQCPVRDDCLRSAIVEKDWDFGVFGGLPPFWRRKAAVHIGEKPLSYARLLGVVRLGMEEKQGYDSDSIDRAEDIQKANEETKNAIENMFRSLSTVANATIKLKDFSSSK